MKWISIKDEKPNSIDPNRSGEDQYLLCVSIHPMYKESYITLAFYCSGDWYESEIEYKEDIPSDVTHWMQIPDKP